MLLIQEFQALQCQEMGEYGGPLYWIITFLSMPLSKLLLLVSGRILCKVDLGQVGSCYAMFLSNSS